MKTLAYQASSQDGKTYVDKHGTCLLPHHINITTMLQNNHHSEAPENQLKGSPKTKDTKKKPN